jgi:hypothetical protein
VARWIMTDPDNLSEGNSVRLKKILARCATVTDSFFPRQSRINNS